MLQVKTTEVSSRLGDFTVIMLGQTVLISQCDTRVRILAALAEGPLTSDQLTQKVHVSYSAVMDHMDFLERIGVVKATLAKRNGERRREGRRRIQFHLNENPLEGIEELFMTAKNGKVRV